MEGLSKRRDGIVIHGHTLAFIWVLWFCVLLCHYWCNANGIFSVEAASASRQLLLFLIRTLQNSVFLTTRGYIFPKFCHFLMLFIRNKEVIRVPGGASQLSHTCPAATP